MLGPGGIDETATDRATIFENSKIYFNNQFPNATILIAGSSSTVSLGVVDYINDSSYISLDVDLKQATSFARYTTNSTTGLFTFNPISEDVGFYVISGTISDGSGELERTM